MPQTASLIQRDLAHVWHPCTQMKDHELAPPVEIVSAAGPYLYGPDGKPIIDAISSWWCKSLGHAHPQLRDAVTAQMYQFEHIMLAGTTYTAIVELSETLAQLCPPLKHVFYVDNGSTAVEVAMKMALQYHQQSGHPERTGFAALHNGYHGETALTLAAGDCDLYSAPYQALLPKITKLGPLPLVSGPNHPHWDTIPEALWQQFAAALPPPDQLAAIVLEPIVQGAGGMRLYSPDLLRRLRQWTHQHNVLLIADEIMSGLGRTGKAMACEHAGITPDLAVFSKALTGGWLPMAVVLAPTSIYEVFYDDYWSGHGFMHSNTYCGNALAVAAARAAMSVYAEEDTFARVEKEGPYLQKLMQETAANTGCLRNLRGIGFVAAADIVNPATGTAYPKERRMGMQLYHEGIRRGAWLRPLGDTIYFMPPLNTAKNVLDDLAAVATAALLAVCQPPRTPTSYKHQP